MNPYETKSLLFSVRIYVPISRTDQNFWILNCNLQNVAGLNSYLPFEISPAKIDTVLIWCILTCCRWNDSYDGASIALLCFPCDYLFLKAVIDPTRGMFHNKINLISSGCPLPSIALQVRNRGLNQSILKAVCTNSLWCRIIRMKDERKTFHIF